MRTVVCAILLAGASAAHAADWQLVGEALSAGNSVKDYVDASTLRQGVQAEVRYTRMTKYMPPIRAGSLSYSARRTQETVNCLKRTVTLNSVVYFDDDGRPLGELRPSSLPRRIAPNSEADAIRQFVCQSASQR